MSDELSPNSPSSNAGLTPDSDSEDSDLEIGELGKSFQLQPWRKDVEIGKELEEGDKDNDNDDNDEKGYQESERQRASVSTVQSYQLYTPDEEQAVVRKLDRKLVLFVALLYMLSFLDRSSALPFLCTNTTVDCDRYWECQNRWPRPRPQS
jgi:hypothetical protein